MKKSNVFSIILLTIIVLYSSLAMADNIKVQNNASVNIKSIECFSEYGTEPDSLALTNLAAGSSVDVPFAKFPDQQCSRLVFTMDDGKKLQFYVEHEVGSLESFSIELSPIARHSEHTVPLYTAKNEDYLEQKVAGLPLFMFAQLFVDSPVKDFSFWITPKTKLGSDNANVLSFAGISWDVAKDSMKVQDDKLKNIRFEVPFMLTPANIATLVEDINGAEFELKQFSVDGQQKSPQGKGSDAINEAFQQCIDAKNCQLFFQKPSINATLSLINGQSMQLSFEKSK